jgi:hypothetical protein
MKQSHPLIMADSEELKKILKSALTEALSEYDGAPALLDRNGLALKLGCSPGHIDNQRKIGMPFIMIGSAVRFDLKTVLEYLKNQSKANVNG